MPTAQRLWLPSAAWPPWTALLAGYAARLISNLAGDLAQDWPTPVLLSQELCIIVREKIPDQRLANMILRCVHFGA